MKNHKLLLFLLTGQLLASGLAAQTADDLVSAGRACLVAHNLTGAYSNFNAAVTLSPTNEAANALAAATRILLLPQQPAGSNFLNSLKFSTGGRDVYNWTSTLPHDLSGHTVLPTNNTSMMIAFYRTNIMVALAASRTNLARITNQVFTLSLTADETSIESVTLDYGDIRLLQAMLYGAEFLGYTADAHNFNFVISHLHDLDQTNGLTIQHVLSDYPSLLNLSNTTDLASSKGAFTNAIVLYQQASDFIRNVRSSGAVRLFNLETNELTTEAQFRDYLAKTLQSLNGPVKFNTNDVFSLYAGAYFARTNSLRSLVPQFNGNRYVNNTLPDYTFGGFLVNDPACDTEAFFRKHLGRTSAGIYGGQVNDLTFDDPGAGIFGVFVSTNQQVTVVGYDTDSFQNINEAQSGGVGAQFNVDQHGNWQFNSNSLAGVSGHGSISDNGSFYGTLNFTNGDSVQLNGSQQSPLGPFQNAAGGYSGTWSGTFGGQAQSGTLNAVMDAAGQIAFCIFHNGAQNDGGLGQFDSNNQFTTTDTASGSTISGTLTNSTLKIGGTASNPDGSAKWTLTRSASVPFDVPPAITTPPQNKNVTAGSNVTFSVTATGSAPLCYQWYCNGTNISGATATSLVVSNVPLSASGNSYSVSVRNVVGGTNATATLIVVPETVKPTLQITAPTSGLQVSNANYTVTGTAGDNVGVSNVFYSLNNLPWAAASTTNNWTNWTAAVTLAQGTNKIAAYAVDTSGNLSTTNSVSFVYVISDTLQVRIVGKGILSPNYSNAVLQIGVNYSMTATGTNGYAFTNWVIATNWIGDVTTNNATVQFVMASNLTLQATFVDVTKPTNTITAPTAGQRWSNLMFTVTGTAKDNAAVSTVRYQLNGSAWTNASSTNGWTNWTTAVSLLPGTNLVQAYAVDTSTNQSTTNSVSFQFVVTNQLQIRASGLGTISPNYSNAWLEIGRNYTTTATAATNGFVFTNWVVSTNWIGGTIITKSNLQFMMASNLTLQVNFADVARPTNRIIAPTAGQKLTNAVTIVKGTASDNYKVASVFYQLNTNVWATAGSTNGFTNWTATVALLAGTNTVKAYAMDTTGNVSTTNSVSFVSPNAFLMYLSCNPTQTLTSGGFGLIFNVSTGLACRIEVSTNLLNWATLTNFFATNVTINFRDSMATNYHWRFYRAVTP